MNQDRFQGIPAEVREFLTKEITSVEQIEILLLLRRTAPRAWTALEVSAEIRGHPDSAKRRLEGFLTRRLVNVEGEEVPPRFLFNPEPNRIAEVVEALEWVYGQKKARVIEFLFSRPNDPVRDFADAFNLRKE